MTKRNFFLAAVMASVAAATALWMAAQPTAPSNQEAPRALGPAGTTTEAPTGSTGSTPGPDAAQAATPDATAGQSRWDGASEPSTIELPTPVSSQEAPVVPELEALPTPSVQPVGEELIRVPSATIVPADGRPEIELQPELQTSPGNARELVDAVAPGQGATSTR